MWTSRITTGDWRRTGCKWSIFFYPSQHLTYTGAFLKHINKQHASMASECLLFTVGYIYKGVYRRESNSSFCCSGSNLSMCYSHFIVYFLLINLCFLHSWGACCVSRVLPLCSCCAFNRHVSIELRVLRCNLFEMGSLLRNVEKHCPKRDWPQLFLAITADCCVCFI